MFFPFSRKASANLWWIIIGAVIALIVVIILLVIFTEKTSTLDRGLNACEGKGGVCAGVSQPCPTGTLLNNAFECSDSAASCCLGVPKRCAGGTRDSEGVHSICGKDVCQQYGSKKIEYCQPKSK
ncbi:TPA: hypothetical protein HA278_06485 [Candidatus Woesearchaeota archaeon]|nr:hypothetical protein [Candidatus Woesearchaeota archaeon]